MGHVDDEDDGRMKDLMRVRFEMGIRPPLSAPIVLVGITHSRQNGVNKLRHIHDALK